MLLFLLNYKASSFYYYFDLYQNRLICVSLKTEAKIPKEKKKKRFGSEVLNTVCMSARVSERSSLLQTDRVLLSVQIPKVTELALRTTRSSTFVVERKHQYSSTSHYKQENLPGCFQMLQGK